MSYKRSKKARDNRSDQLNPNNKKYWHSRGLEKPEPLRKKRRKRKFKYSTCPSRKKH